MYKAHLFTFHPPSPVVQFTFCSIYIIILDEKLAFVFNSTLIIKSGCSVLIQNFGTSLLIISCCNKMYYDMMSLA